MIFLPPSDPDRQFPYHCAFLGSLIFTATIGRMTLSLDETSNVFAIIAASHAGFPFNTPVPAAVAPAAPVLR